MWTGTGDFESSYPTQWALNPSAYQNIPSEQVDWATLAQQWIIMKETFPVDQVPPAPPPPDIKADIEAGEAPMDMSKDEATPITTTVTPQDGNNWNSWNSWQQWNWNWEGTGKGVTGASGPGYNYPQAPAPPSFSGDMPPTTFDYNHGAPAPAPNSFDQQGYWSGSQAPYVRNKPSSEWRNEGRGPSSSRRQHPKGEEVEPDTMTMLDAAKRKQLPAWIREGLEKMEREKQRKLDRERQLKEREEELSRRKQEEEEALASGIPLKSKFDTDSESEKEPEEVPVKQRRSRFDASIPGSSSPVSQPLTTIARPVSPPLPVRRKTKDEVMQDVMQQMRYVLTDILMSVTNEEMQRISEEVLSELRAKAPATQLRKTPAFTSLTGKLGLGIYDSDSEDSAAESDDEPATKKENGVDSDEELRERISRKKQEFAKIERDIDHMVELQEERDREREQAREREEEEEDVEDPGQVEPKLPLSGNRLEVKIEEQKAIIEPQVFSNQESFTPERPVKTERQSSDEHTEDSNNETSSKSDSSSTSSSGSRRKKYKKSKKKKEKKRKRKRSLSGSRDSKKSSRKKSSHKYEERERVRQRSRSRSRSHRSHHSSESRKRRRHSYSHSPEYGYARGKKSSHRSRD